ncbi:hypothetical protein Q8A64_09475 [Oxalobacteraceae bacterium R-40]|uniref:Uncharacterized protein n=1 Tax=Keguizhuia sedimenti TaxID=3064264 RepID=A0ABU1BP44_9BURK|nr:hypothetical protein [Oxalobacteraceae bacterium R-40]
MNKTGDKVIIDDILEALEAFEAHGKPAKSVFLGAQRMEQLQQVTAAYRAAVAPEELITATFLGLPVKEGDFPADYIGFGIKD